MHRHSLILNLSSRQTRRVLTHTSRRQHSQASQILRPVSEEECKFIEKSTKRLVDRAARGPAAGWRHTKTLRGEEKRLLDLVQTGFEQEGLKSPEDATEDSLDDITFSPQTDESIAPGTFVELRVKESSSHGIALSEHFMDRSWYIIALVSTGKVQVHPKGNVSFTIPSVASVDLARRCGTSDVARTQKEAMARVETLKRLREIEKAVEAAYTAVGQKTRAIYSQVKSPDPDQWSQVELAQAVRLILPHPDIPLVTVFAVHKNLMNLNKEFLPDFLCYRTSQTFDVRPQSHVDAINAVTAMSRMSVGPLDAFAKRVKHVAALNRKRFAESRDEPPSHRQVDNPVFTRDDKVIIDFLVNSMDRRTQTQYDPYKLPLAAVLKKLDVYTSQVDVSLVHQVLVDTGVFPPWQDLFARLREYDLCQGPRESSARVTEDDALVKKALSARTLSSTTAGLNLNDFYPSDPAESIRHDFGDMPVYVIDEATAEELDDGFSFEAIPSEPESAWVHVHIADPTAVIPPTHPIALHARKQCETAYFLHRTWPMLPSSLVQEKFSLCSRASGVPHQVLTFSFKVDSNGNITDYYVRPALIRNVHVLSYDSVDLAMGSKPPHIKYPFGAPKDITQPAPVHLELTHLENLHALREVTDRLVAARLRLPTFSQSPDSFVIDLSPKPLVFPSFDIMKPTLFRGFPRMTYSVSTWKDLDVGSRRLVSELMKASCRVASRFCLDHGIPILRRASGRIMTKTESDFETLLSMRDSSGYVDYLKTVHLNAVTPAAEFTLEPKMHWSLGVAEGEGYVRVTSPLRRYDDMVSHWQIKHALIGSKGELPFSKEVLVKNGKNSTLKQSRRKQTMNSHEKFWALLFIQRWLEDESRHESGINPLDDLVGFAVSETRWDHKTKGSSCLVRLPKLGVNAMLEGLGMQADVPLGSEIPVRITDLKLGLSPYLTVVRR